MSCPPSSAPAIRTSGLTRSFGRVRALDALTLEIPRGAIFGFLGPNGAGKTTTVRVLLGLLAPDEGTAEVLGLDLRAQAAAIRAATGALLEHHGLYERLSAEENLLFHARIRGLPPPQGRARVAESLERIGLHERRAEPIAGWSRGMKQRLAVARAVLHRPPLLFLDEPTSGLDPVASADLHEELRNLAFRDGTTVFLTTHNLAEAEKLCTMVGVIRAGRLLAVGAPRELRARPQAPSVHIRGEGFNDELLGALRAHPEVASLAAGRSAPQSDVQELSITLRPGGDAAEIVTWLVTRGARVEEARRESASLEEVFLALVREEPQEKGAP